MEAAANDTAQWPCGGAAGQRRERDPRQPVERQQRKRILERDGYRCQFCDEDERAWLRVDHKVPFADGGTDDDDNLWTLCLWCNSIKARRVAPFQLGLPTRQCGSCGLLDCDVEHPGSFTQQRDRRDAARRAAR